MSRHTDGDFSVSSLVDVDAQPLFTIRRQKRGFFFVPVVVNVPRTKVQCVWKYLVSATQKTHCVVLPAVRLWS